MCKKKYYNLIEQYHELTEQMAMNEMFVDMSYFRNVKSELLELLNGATTDTLSLGTNLRYNRLSSLARKIAQEECIEESDYVGTYYERKFFGLLSIRQFGFLLLSCCVFWMWNYFPLFTHLFP